MILGDLKAQRYTITSYCVSDHLTFCTHSATLDLDVLIERFGADFEIAHRHAWFLSHLRCARCGRRSAEIRIGGPPHEPSSIVSSW